MLVEEIVDERDRWKWMGSGLSRNLVVAELVCREGEEVIGGSELLMGEGW